MRPRSATEIADRLRTADPDTTDAVHHRDGVLEVLKDLEADGLVVNLGTFDDPDAALAAQDKHKDAIDFEGDRAVFANMARGPLGYPFLDREDHWAFTKACHARLIGEVPA
jgi:hypothetical protein